MRRFALSMAFLALGASPALADGSSGGVSAPGGPIKAGGVAPGAGAAPVAQLSVPTPISEGAPKISVRFDERGVDFVTARVVVLRSPGNAVAGRIALGQVPTGRTVTVPWKGTALPAGRYVVRVHAHDRWNNQLRRMARTSGKATLVVRAAQTAATASPPPSSPPSPHGVFPVAGPHTYGEGLGADRGDHSHQGQDLAAAAGTPVVAPLSGTIATRGYQANGAGYYVVLDAGNGRSYFFAHCQKGSIAVTTGQPVQSGAALCRVGSTGRSTGPHLHFEEWVNGWRTGSKSKPIDPLPQLRAWDS